MDRCACPWESVEAGACVRPVGHPGEHRVPFLHHGGHVWRQTAPDPSVAVIEAERTMRKATMAVRRTRSKG